MAPPGSWLTNPRIWRCHFCCNYG